MRAVRTVLLVLVALVLAGPLDAAAQQPSIGSQTTLDRLLAERTRQDQSDRQVVREFLQRAPCPLEEAADAHVDAKSQASHADRIPHEK